jgi:outer membrane protein OmpA-like peptidoglycan-associated protein
LKFLTSITTWGKWNIREDAAVELDKVVQFLKDNETITIELGSHTDARGSKSSNQTLSQKRAESAVNYIVTNGIDQSRISARGYGEERLKNRCADGVRCSEDEHQENRRTEIKIVSF